MQMKLLSKETDSGRKRKGTTRRDKHLNKL